MRFNFCHRRRLDQRANNYPRFSAYTHFHRSYFCAKLFGKRIVNSVLHIKPVGTHTSLPCVAVFGNNRAIYCRIKIRIVKHNKRRIAAKLQRQLFNSVGRLLEQYSAHFGGPCERHFAHGRTCTHNLTYRRSRCRIARNNIQYTRRNTGLIGQFNESKRTQRRRFGRLDNKSTPDS